ncbi:sodium:proton antiporter [Deinococcus irradiatisoli]|uniref:Sodium:proton antiporter n=1 Tax=Deinococcus irradiatisoli TaxID=2202254 RepID=A0A2Z3JFV3_9DEIO|nr:cation:proton antiporter [Deinococcus irradiatisoli]AWN24067.1 sodium:proton antiporter [Deinococcus irradiatisoli]
MATSGLFGIFVALLATLSFLNSRYWKLPPTIGILVGGLLMAGGVALAAASGWPLGIRIRDLVQGIPFGTLVFGWLLSFLLFSSTIQIDVKLLFRKGLAVTALTLITTLVTMLLLGLGMHLLLNAVGLHASWPVSLLFGAILAPTDPVAVMPLLRAAHVPKTIETLIAGESLFNDGVGVVAFTVLAQATMTSSGAGAQDITFLGTLTLFLREMLGGLLLGALLGGAASFLIRRTPRDENTRLTMSLAMVVGGNALAQGLEVSAPVTVAASGLILVALLQLWRRRVRQSGLLAGLPPDERKHLREIQARLVGFWEFVDYLLNAALFTVMAFEVLSLNYDPLLLLLAPVAILLNVAARSGGVWLTVGLLRRSEHFPTYTRRLMTWAGLRGGVTLALAFSLPDMPLRPTFLALSYAVVVFSMLVQGLSLPALARRLSDADKAKDPPHSAPAD